MVFIEDYLSPNLTELVMFVKYEAGEFVPHPVSAPLSE